MRCPYCGSLKDRVVDSRESQGGKTIRRRRECLHCKRRFTSYERIDEIPIMVVKKGGRRERFDRSKLLSGLLKACEKRPVSPALLEEIVNGVEMRLRDSCQRELVSSEIGHLVMERLKQIDKVAYIRFASVYREFQDVGEFAKEVKELS